jgi:hypothetical protein
MIKGRIGNQLFQYAYARAVQNKMEERSGEKCQIIIDDVYNNSENYYNSLQNYSLHNVIYVSDRSLLHGREWKIPYFVQRVLNRLEIGKSDSERHIIEKRNQKFLNMCGVIKCDEDYIEISDKYSKDVIIDGYFQSEKFFYDVKDEIKQIFRIEDEVDKSGYPNLEMIKKRNTVCISIKVQHNVGNPMYDLCHEDYYEKAIKCIIDQVDDPLFFICSDNVKYVKEHLIDCTKYDIVEQSNDFPVHISLAVMALCKHFIIGNTSFGWWAQYLSDYSNKIVIAPSRWYGNDAPYKNIYMKEWILIDV